MSKINIKSDEPFLLRLIRKIDGYARKHPIAFTVWLVVAALALFSGFRYFWGVEQVGHFLEKESDYETIQYVNLFENKNLAKNYRLKAKIWRITDKGRETRLEEIYFPDGGSISFEDSFCNLELNKKISCGDSKGNWWYIELISAKP